MRQVRYAGFSLAESRFTIVPSQEFSLAVGDSTQYPVPFARFDSFDRRRNSIIPRPSTTGACLILSLRRLWPYVVRYRVTMGFGFLSLILTNLVMLIAPKILQMAIDSLRVASDGSQLLSFGTLFFIVMVVQGVFRYLVRQTLGVVSRRIEYDLRNDLYAHLQSLPLTFFQQMRTGDILSRLSNDLQAVRNLLGPGVMYSANAIIVFIAVLFVVLSMSPKLTALALLPMVALPLFSNRMSRRLYDRSKQVQEQIAEISGLANETIAGVRTIKAYHREKVTLERFRAESKAYITKSMALVKIEGAIWPLMGTLSGVSSVITIWYGGYLVIHGELSLGALVAFETYLGFLMWPLMAFGWVLNVVQRGNASMSRLTELLDAQPAKTDTETLENRFTITGEVEFKNLTFSYDGVTTILKDISFKLEAGKTLAIIGRTGAGKSTLINLIARLYDPPPGTVFIDGVDILSIPLTMLRDALGPVPQDTVLFSRTIAENIAYGNPDASSEVIKAGADMAQIANDIESFPAGYATILGERGVTLSGGQKQRTALARAILNTPKILLLDDALSSVDTYTEEEILKRLRGVMGRCTTVIVAHRMSTVTDADQILSLDEGRIVEQGNHAALVTAGGLYASLYEKQLLQDSLTNLK